MGTAKARREVRIDPDLDDLIEAPAQHLHVTKTAFVTQTLRQAALRVTARADTTLMYADVFDAMVESLEIPHESAALDDLASLPRRIAR